ncbi:MAG: TonB-dependent receptor [Acidobacteria bacterium]|nr:TonB-dependent receptor [Acidobacteriota bacterium]
MSSLSSRWKSVRLGFVLATSMALLEGPALAQSSTGTVSGTVVDESGGVLPGATVTAKNVGTGASRTVVSGGSGGFTFALLPVGTYDVSAGLSGFATARTPNVKVDIGGDVTLRLTMKLAGVTADVVVSMEAPLIETTRSQVSSVVNEKLITNLPTNGRNFIDFVLTTPGVVKDVRLGDISFAGQRGTLNSLVVDGADNNNTFFGQALGRTGSGRAPYQFSQDAVAEFQVNSNAYSAEYGRAGGAVINVVTKSGTNDFHGSGFYFYRDKSLNANDYINVINGRVKSPYHFDQFGASLGGPILQDRLFFFANYDGQRNTIPNLVVLGVPQGGYPTDAASQAGLATLRTKADSWERAQDQDVFLLKVDAELGKTRVSMRYNRQSFTGQNFENGGITNAQEHTGNSNVATDTLSASISSSFSPVLYNELRGQYAKDKEPGQANSANPEAVIRQGGTTILTIGRNFFSPRETTIDRFQVADTLTLLLDRHTLKAGFDYNQDDILNFFPGNFSGSYTFNSLAGFNSGRPDSYVQAFAGAGTTGATTNPDLKELAFFVQDEFRLSSKFTINAGLRYDRTSIAQPSVQNPDAQALAAGIDTRTIHEDKNNWAARLGFAFSPADSGRTVIRGGYGLFYGRVPAIMIGTAHSNNGINVQTITYTQAQLPPCLVYPANFGASCAPPTAAPPKPTIFYFDRDFESPRVQQASLGFEQGLTDQLAVSISALHVKADNLSRSIDTNVGSFTTQTLVNDQGQSFSVRRYDATRPYTNFARTIAFQSSAESEYNGASLELKKRYGSHWQGSLSYTYSKVIDTKPDATAVVPGGSDDTKYIQDPLNIDGDRAVGDNDVTHRVVLSGVWDLDYFKGSDFASKYLLSGWSLAGIFSYATGQPYTATVAAAGALSPDLNNDGNRNNDRAPGFGRNTFRLPAQMSLDPRITKTFDFGAVRLQLIGEAFNLLNRATVSGVRTVYYTYQNVGTTPTLVKQSSFGSATVSSGPRIVQLAAKVIF